MGGSGEESEQSNNDTISLEVWYTFTVDSMEEEVFLEAVNDFSLDTGIDVKVTNKPYDDSDQQFQIAAQGGEAPDLLRVSSDSLGKFGETRVDGYPLFEDLRPHITPQQRNLYDPISMDSMRYGESLNAIPASFDCLSLIYNKALFDGIEEPNANWTIDDLMTTGEQVGLQFPVKSAYWWLPFLGGFGGELFDEDGNPTFDEGRSAESLQWVMDLLFHPGRKKLLWKIHLRHGNPG